MRIKDLLLITSFLFLSLQGSSQSNFYKSFKSPASDDFNAVDQTPDNGYILVGETNGFDPSYNTHSFLTKKDWNGNTTWSKKFKLFNSSYAYDVKRTSDSGYIFCGSTLNMASSNIYPFLVKTDAMGNISWAKVLYTNSGEFWNLKEIPNSGYIATGISNGDILLAKFNYSGTLIWEKNYGGPSTEYGNYIDTINRQGFIITGFTTTVNGDKDIIAMQTDTSGNMQWVKKYSGSKNEWGGTIKVIKDGGFCIAGTTSSYGAGKDDSFLMKIGSSGNPLWAKAYGGAGIDRGNSVIELPDKSLIILTTDSATSLFDTDMNLIKTDPSGNILWVHQFGTSTAKDNGTKIIQTHDKGFVMIGSASSSGSSSCIITKTDVNGNTQCHIKPSEMRMTNFSPSVSIPAFIVTSLNDSCRSANVTSQIITFLDSTICTSCDPLSVNFTNTINQQTVRFTNSSSGDVGCKWYFGDGDSSSLRNPIHTYHTQGVYHVRLNGYNLCKSDTLGMKISITMTGVYEDDFNKKIKLSPNPFSNTTILSIEGVSMTGRPEVEIYDMYGKMVKAISETHSNQIIISREGLASGVYLYKLKYADKIATGKLMIE